jgi:hypothetical protein
MEANLVTETLPPASDETCFRDRPLGEFANVLCQTRLVPCGSISVNNTLIDRFIYQGHGWVKQLLASALIVRCQCRSQLLYLSTEFAPIAAIYLVSFYVLSNAFLC